MRRVAFIAPALLALSLSACTSGDAEPGEEADAKPASATSAGSSTLDLKLPKNAKYLIPETTGSGTKKIDPFLSEKDVYTVHVRCDGEGIFPLGTRRQIRSRSSAAALSPSATSSSTRGLSRA